jgi:hypothetical protein
MEGCSHASFECEQDPQRRLFQFDYTKPDGDNRRYFCREHISAAAKQKLKYVAYGPFTIIQLPIPTPAAPGGPLFNELMTLTHTD